jgi:hypothetical protein
MLVLAIVFLGAHTSCEIETEVFVTLSTSGIGLSVANVIRDRKCISFLERLFVLSGATV